MKASIIFLKLLSSSYIFTNLLIISNQYFFCNIPITNFACSVILMSINHLSRSIWLQFAMLSYEIFQKFMKIKLLVEFDKFQIHWMNFHFFWRIISLQYQKVSSNLIMSMDICILRLDWTKKKKKNSSEKKIIPFLLPWVQLYFLFLELNEKLYKRHIFLNFIVLRKRNLYSGITRRMKTCFIVVLIYSSFPRVPKTIFAEILFLLILEFFMFGSILVPVYICV